MPIPIWKNRSIFSSFLLDDLRTGFQVALPLGPALGGLYFLFFSSGDEQEHRVNFYNAFEAIFPIFVSGILLVRSQRVGEKV